MISLNDLVVSSEEAWRIIAWCEVRVIDIDWQLKQWRSDLNAAVSS